MAGDQYRSVERQCITCCMCRPLVERRSNTGWAVGELATPASTLIPCHSPAIIETIINRVTLTSSWKFLLNFLPDRHPPAGHSPQHRGRLRDISQIIKLEKTTHLLPKNMLRELVWTGAMPTDYFTTFYTYNIYIAIRINLVCELRTNRVIHPSNIALQSFYTNFLIVLWTRKLEIKPVNERRK